MKKIERDLNGTRRNSFGAETSVEHDPVAADRKIHKKSGA
jgi:hypothetical protein